MIFFSKIDNTIKEVIGNISEVFSLVFVRIYLGILCFLSIFSWLFCYLFYTKVSQSLIILHYNVDFGVDLIGDVKKIFIIPTLGLFVIFFNFILIFIFLKNENFKFISHLLLGTAVIVNLFLFLSLGPIYLINFR